ncbi:MAG: ribosomal L7Ae/L30e/S12e/Gadd45 family protein [Clostridia bacterium]|nr:ribosomal L7Ae/L30e/S12e/Gadd45 family protein [Clostridia bacterium]
MERSKTESLLGFARKAGKVVSGYHKCLDMLKKNRIKLIITAEDVSQNTKDKFSHLCETRDIPFGVTGTIESLSLITGNDGRGVYGITDANFAQAIIKEIRHDKVAD